MSLQQWLQNNTVVTHQPSIAEVRNLLGVIDRELSDATATGLSAEGVFIHAYEAALLLCKLALHVSGFRLARGAKGHHALWIDSLRYTLGEAHKGDAAYLSKCSTQRHHSVYDYAGVVARDDADELLHSARQLRDQVLTWLRTNYATLLLPKDE